MSLDNFFSEFGGIKRTTVEAPKKEPMTVEHMFMNSITKMKKTGMKNSSWYDKKKNVVVPKVGIYKLFDTKDKKDGFTIDESQWNKFLDRLTDMYNEGNLKEQLKEIGIKQKKAIDKRKNNSENK